jgi:hypothetical protein
MLQWSGLLRYTASVGLSEVPAGQVVGVRAEGDRKESQGMIPDQFPFHPEHIPRELKAGRFWVVCDEEKVPYVAGENRRAKSSDPSTWRSYGEAVRAFRSGRCAGVGRVITEKCPYAGVDLDHVRDPASGVIAPEALAILEDLGSYSEVSPSGEGVKVWIRARLDRSYVRPGLEVYQRGRYFVTTGSLLPQYPATIEDRQEEIVALVDREFPAARRGRPRTPYDGPELALVEYLDGVEVIGEVPDGLGVKFKIRCPWVAEHTNGDVSGTYVGQRADGGCWFSCWHAHCYGRVWRDFRRYINCQQKRQALIQKGRYA